MRAFSRILVLFGFLLVLLPVATANAKGNGHIAGSIISASGNPLHDAIIKIFRQVRQGESLSIARSDSHGFFRSANLTPGIYYLQVSRQGYQPATTAKFTVDPGRTVSLDIILQDLIDYISNNDDPRNWDIRTLMRSTSDRRLIFRDVPGNTPPGGENAVDAPFYRSGAMNIASSNSGEDYLARPQTSQYGVSSNFAFTEPLSQHSRMILSGQLDFGNGSFWRVRNTYNWRPDNSHDYRVSVGYGQMNVNYPGSSSISSQFISQESGLRDLGVQTLAFGVDGSTKLLDMLSVKYGFDYSRLHYGMDRSFFYPSVQILLTPTERWSLQTSFTSQRISDTNTVVLPDGELLNLSEPTLITMVGDHVSMSQIRHSEVAAQRVIAPDTSIEFAVYQDRIQGPGLPIMLTTITPLEHRSHVVEMNEDHSSQRGLRLTVKHKILDNLSGSVAYVLGDATSISGLDGFMSSDQLDGNLTNYLQRRRQHSITGRIDAIMPITKTNLLATVRWYSGNPLTPADWFSDRIDIGTKSTNFEIRQALPVPDLLGTAGQWEVLVDLQNILDQGREILPITDGEVVLNRNPRSLRFGLSFNFR